MYPVKGGQRIKVRRVIFRPTELKYEKLSIATTADEKQSVVDVSGKYSKDVSNFGHRVIMWAVNLDKILPKGVNLFTYLDTASQAMEELQNRENADRQTIELLEAKVSRLQKEIDKKQEIATLKIEKLQQENEALKSKLKEKEEKEIAFEVSPEMKEAFHKYDQYWSSTGENQTKESMLAHLIYKDIIDYNEKMGAEFGLCGHLRKLLKRLRKK